MKNREPVFLHNHHDSRTICACWLVKRTTNQAAPDSSRRLARKS